MRHETDPTEPGERSLTAWLCSSGPNGPGAGPAVLALGLHAPFFFFAGDSFREVTLTLKVSQSLSWFFVRLFENSSLAHAITCSSNVCVVVERSLLFSASVLQCSQGSTNRYTRVAAWMQRWSCLVNMM